MARAQAEGPFVVDLEAFPLVWLHSPSASEYEYVDVTSYYVCTDRALAREAPYVVLHDARDLPYVDHQRQKRFLAELTPRRAKIIKYLLGYAAIVSSPFERGLVTALSWYARIPMPTRLFTNEVDARAFLLDRYARATGHAMHDAPLAAGRR